MNGMEGVGVSKGSVRRRSSSWRVVWVVVALSGWVWRSDLGIFERIEKGRSEGRTVCSL
jgi:hypothetical protein